MSLHLYSPKVLLVTRRNDEDFKELYDNLNDEGVTVYIARTVEEVSDCLALINIDGIVLMDHFQKEAKITKLLKNPSAYPFFIVVHELEENHTPALGYVSAYLTVAEAKNALSDVCFDLIDQRKGFKKAA
jgi:hypothetical protein